MLFSKYPLYQYLYISLISEIAIAQKFITWLGFLRFCNLNPNEKFDLFPYMAMLCDQHSCLRVKKSDSENVCKNQE